MSDEVTIQRLLKESEELERYEAEILETAARLKLYRQRFGCDPESTAALEQWARESLQLPIDPYSVLSREEIAQVWEDAIH
jgi:hypothetical protein